MHYAAVLNEYSLAGEIVDNLRATTDASLDVCIEAAKNVARLIGQYVRSEYTTLFHLSDKLSSRCNLLDRFETFPSQLQCGGQISKNFQICS